MTTKNPQLYRELNVPFEGMAAAEAALEAFFKEVREVREKHRIADVTTACMVSIKYEDGE